VIVFHRKDTADGEDWCIHCGDWRAWS